MTLNYDCGNHEALVGYLYDECDPAERNAVAAHLAVCTRCAKEIAALRATRTELTAWTPPAAQLGFRIAADVTAAPAATVLRPSRWWRQPLPAWAQAAAALLIFSVGLGLGALRGSSAPRPAATAAAGAAATPTPQPAVSPRDLAALEQRLRAEMQARPVSSTVAASPVGAATLQQVRALIAESEQRQQRELALRTAEVIRDFDTQRRGDLARIERTFGQMEGTTGAQVEQQRQMLNYLMRVSQRQP